MHQKPNASSWLVIFQQGFPALQLKAALSSCAQVKTHWSSGLKAEWLCKQEQDTKITSPSGYEQQQTASSSWIWRSWRRGWLRGEGISEVSSPPVRLWCRWPSTSLPLSQFHFLWAHPPVREFKQTVHHKIKILSLFTHAYALFGTDQSLKHEGEQIITFFLGELFTFKKQSVCDELCLQIVTQPSVSPQV